MGRKYETSPFSVIHLTESTIWRQIGTKPASAGFFASGRMIAKKGLRAMLALLLRLLRLAKAGAKSLRLGMMHSQPALG
jgi:hypothetical protein